jgi:hypothetical protein
MFSFSVSPGFTNPARFGSLEYDDQRIVHGSIFLTPAPIITQTKWSNFQ